MGTKSSTVAQVIGDGNVTKERIEQLEEMREKLGLAKEAADKIVNGVRNQRLIGDLNVSSLLLGCLSQQADYAAGNEAY